jgi:hypothetical protein
LLVGLLERFWRGGGRAVLGFAACVDGRGNRDLHLFVGWDEGIESGDDRCRFSYYLLWCRDIACSLANRDCGAILVK